MRSTESRWSQGAQHWYRGELGATDVARARLAFAAMDMTGADMRRILLAFVESLT